MDVAYELVRHVAERRFEDLPSDVVEREKWLILDSIGVMLAGSTAAPTPQLVSVLRAWGGSPESTVCSHSVRLPSVYAAWANGTMAHARDFDDSFDGGGGHTHPGNVAAALAVAEARGGASGRELLAAVTLAVDVMCRLARARTTGQNFLTTSTIGIMAAALAAGKMAGLPRERLHDALGISFHQVGGTVQAVHEGKLLKRMQAGFAARNGVASAALAKAGVDGPRNCLEGEYGYFTLYERGNYDPSQILEDLGEDYLNLRVGMKPYPCARDHHGLVEAALVLAADHDLHPEDVASGVAWIPADAYVISGGAWPPPEGETEVHSLRSGAFGVAAAIARRRLGLAEFTPEARGDPAIRDLASRIEVRIDPSNTDPKGRVPQALELTLRDGRKVEHRIDCLKGHVDRPLSEAESLGKFNHCADFSARSRSPEDVARLAECILSLDRLEDVRELAALIA